MHTSHRFRAPLIGAVLVIATVTAACSAQQGSDKAGNQTVVLKLASIDEVKGNGQSLGPQAFIDGLGKVSGGRLKVEVATPYGDPVAESESNLVKAIASGQVDGGWPSTRSFAAAGIHGLEAVEAPMTIVNYNAEKALVADPVAGSLLAQLSSTPVLGLGLTVGPLRRPFAVKTPLLGPEDWKGVSFRVYNSPVQTEAVQALGATPRNLGFNWPDEVRAGNLGGLEFDIPQYVMNDDTTEAGNITANLVLWPKVFVLSMNRSRFDALTTQQQGWIRTAAQQAVAASAGAGYDETTPARALCSVGARFLWASPDQVTAMRTSVQPVLDRLSRDPVSGPLLKAIQAVAARYPQPTTPDVPQDCRKAVTGPAPALVVPDQASALPDGIYRQQLTRPEVEAAGVNTGDGPSGTWTLTVRHARYEVRCRPIANPTNDCGNFDKDVPLQVGALKGTGRTVYFVPDARELSRLTGCKLPVSDYLDDHCGPDTPYRADWATSGDQLTFSGYQTGQGMGLKPWKKIG